MKSGGIVVKRGKSDDTLLLSVLSLFLSMLIIFLPAKLTVTLPRFSQFSSSSAFPASSLHHLHFHLRLLPRHTYY